MKKNLVKSFTAFILLLCTAFLFAGCNLFAKVTSIEIEKPFKTVYELGETINTSNGVLKVTLSNGAQKDVAITKSGLVKLPHKIKPVARKSNITVTGFSTETVGKRTMIIEHENATCTLDYTVTHPFPITEGRYLYYDSSSDYYMYFYKDTDYYVGIKYYMDDSSAALEWVKLQDATYLDRTDASGYSIRFTMELNTNDYYYYMTDVDGENDPIKLISLDIFLIEENYTRYTPAE